MCYIHTVMKRLNCFIEKKETETASELKIWLLWAS